MNYKFEIEDSSKVFFISDFHARHENIIKFCDRPWINKEEMTEGLINNWNSVISPDDIVFNLGDFIWSGSYGAIIPRLNGHIHLILGNHDRHINPTWEKYLAGIYEQLTLLIDNKIVYLNHFPYLCFPENAYQLFGHVHLSKIKNTGEDFQRCQYLLPNQYDVGVDFNNFKPISWKEVKNRIEYQIKNNTNCLIWIENENENN
jgi:calcineurin-like phosphoesterase family protein